MLEPSFPDCRFFMPTTVVDCALGWKNQEVWFLNDSRKTMLLPQRTLLGVGQQMLEGEERNDQSASVKDGVQGGRGEGGVQWGKLRQLKNQGLQKECYLNI